MIFLMAVVNSKTARSFCDVNYYISVEAKPQIQLTFIEFMIIACIGGFTQSPILNFHD